MPRQIVCPKPFSKRDCHTKYLFLRRNLHALMVHLRARGHRATIIKTSEYKLLGVRDETGSLHMCSNDYAASQAVRRLRKPAKPLFPLFTMWQEKRLVLLKGKPKGRAGLAHLR